MNQQTLLYHTKLQDWSQIYHLKADGRVCKASKVHYLPPHKLQQIEVWRKDVSKTLRKTCSARPDRNQPKPPKAGRPVSEIVRTTTPLNGHGRPRPRSAWSATSTNDMTTVTSNLAETSLHYAAQRDQLHRVNSGQSIRFARKPGTAAVAQHHTTVDTPTPQNSTKEDVPDGDSTHPRGVAKDDLEDTDDLSDLETMSSVTQFRMENRGHMIQVKDQVVLSMRSQSNNLLNVLSVDDCKMAMRYRQRNRIIENIPEEKVLNGETNSEGKYNDIESIGRISIDKSKTSYGRRTGGDRVNESKVGGDTKVPVKSRTAKITKAIDNMVHDRKVMNDLDRNFDSRIGSTSRITLDRGEGGKVFRRLNSALKKHVNGLLMHQSTASQRRWYPHTLTSGSSDTTQIEEEDRSNMCTPSEGWRRADSALSDVPPTPRDNRAPANTPRDNGVAILTPRDNGAPDSYRGTMETPTIPEEMDEDQDSFSENSIT